MKVTILLLLPTFVFWTGASLRAQTSLPELSMSGSVSSESTTLGQSLQFWLTIKNRSQENVSLVRMLHAPDGYDLEQVCTFNFGHADNCRDRESFDNGQRMLIPVLAPGQALAVSGRLRARNAHNAQTLAAVLAWQGPAPALVSSSAIVPLGNNQVQTRFQRASIWISDLFKSLAIPAVLAFLGLLLNDLAKRREEQRAKADKELEEKRAKGEKELEEQRAAAEKERQEKGHEHERLQTLRSETWKLLLPISHNYAAKYYLPLSMATERAVQAVRKSNDRLAFYYFLMMLRRMSATIDEIGGFYFKDLRGERLAAKCSNRFREIFLGEQTEAFSLAIRSSADLLNPHGTYDRFKREFCENGDGDFTHPSLREAWTLFKDVSQDKTRMAETTRYLTALYTILDFESNRPYEYWYDMGPQVIVDEDTHKLLKQISEDLKFTDTESNDYLEQMKK